MATCRRPDLLRRCLECLTAQSLDPSAYEIVVVDDGHTASSRAVVEEFDALTRSSPNVRYFESVGTRGPAGARNVGWRNAKAPVIAFTDDDTAPDRHWLREGLAAIDSERCAVSGRTVVPIEGELTDHARMTQGLESAEFITANALVPRKLLEELGGFDERFTRPWREDSDLHFRLLDSGVTIVRAPRAVVVHPVRPAPWGISLGQQANSFFEALLFKKHPRAYRETVTPQVPWRYYFIVASIAAAIAFACAQMWTPAAIALAAAVLTVIEFAMRRLRSTSSSRRHIAEMLTTSAIIPFLSIYWRLRGALHFKVMFW